MEKIELSFSHPTFAFAFALPRFTIVGSESKRNCKLKRKWKFVITYVDACIFICILLFLDACLCIYSCVGVVHTFRSLHLHLRLRLRLRLRLHHTCEPGIRIKKCFLFVTGYSIWLTPVQNTYFWILAHALLQNRFQVVVLLRLIVSENVKIYLSLGSIKSPHLFMPSGGCHLRCSSKASFTISAIPSSWCNSLWQWRNHWPGLSERKLMTT